MAYVLEGFGRVLSCYGDTIPCQHVYKGNNKEKVEGKTTRRVEWIIEWISVLTSLCEDDFFTTRMLNGGMST